MDLMDPHTFHFSLSLLSLYADMAKSAMGSTTTEGEAAKVAKKATGATMLSPDIGDLHVPIVLPTPATEIPSVEMVEVISSGDEEQWTEPINTSPTPEGMSWADMLISQEERDLLDVDTHFASCKALQPVAGMRQQYSKGERCLSAVWPADDAVHTHLSKKPGSG